MNVRKTDAFIADVERQFEWYVVNGGWDVAYGYLDAVHMSHSPVVSLGGNEPLKLRALAQSREADVIAGLGKQIPRVGVALEALGA